ncbi:MAG: hypothetical protein PHN80_11875 [Hespellia sp.]|nr:hypothetical protein [Hespellia sp.]
MKGYINLFEGECLFMCNGAHPLHAGDCVILCEGEYNHQQAKLELEDGKWFLRGEDFRIYPVQGVLARMEEK